MSNVNQIFERGPENVRAWFATEQGVTSWPEMDVKELADISWTRANTLARSGSADARLWAEAALAGYEYLSRKGGPMVARSARENAEALQAWSILRGKAPAA